MSPISAQQPISIPGADGQSTIPWYMIPFDEAWPLPPARSPAANCSMRPRSGGYTDVYLFSHGWNNTWKDAIDTYAGFIRGFMQMRQDGDLPMPEGYKPLRVGIFWLSIALVKDDERAPKIAAGGTDDDDSAAFERREVERLVAGLPGVHRPIGSSS